MLSERGELEVYFDGWLGMGRNGVRSLLDTMHAAWHHTSLLERCMVRTKIPINIILHCNQSPFQPYEGTIRRSPHPIYRSAESNDAPADVPFPINKHNIQSLRRARKTQLLLVYTCFETGDLAGVKSVQSPFFC